MTSWGHSGGRHETAPKTPADLPHVDRVVRSLPCPSTGTTFLVLPASSPSGTSQPPSPSPLGPLGQSSDDDRDEATTVLDTRTSELESTEGTLKIHD